MSLASMATRNVTSVFMSADAVGGVWTYAIELARGLCRAGIDLHLAVLGPRPSSAQQAQAALIKSLSLTITGLPLDWTAVDEDELDDVERELKALAFRSGADLVHLNAPAHVGKAGWPFPLVVAAHSCVATWWQALRPMPLPDDLAWRARRTGAGLALADKVLVPSRAFARSVVSAYGSGLPITVVCNGRSLPQCTGHAKDTVLTTGRLWDPAKNVAAIDQAARLSRVPIYAAGAIRGPNSERPSFPHLRLLGSLSEDDLAPWYARASLFVSVSKYEPFGLAVLEAAQAGAALILSEIPAFIELWNDRALFVPADDHRSLAEAIARLRSDPEATKELADKARTRAKKFSADAMLAGTLRAYQQAIDAHARRHDSRSAA